MAKLPELAKFIFLNTTKRSHFFATVIVLLQRRKITEIVTVTLGKREEVINFPSVVRARVPVITMLLARSVFSFLYLFLLVFLKLQFSQRNYDAVAL